MSCTRSCSVGSCPPVRLLFTVDSVVQVPSEPVFVVWVTSWQSPFTGRDRDAGACQAPPIPSQRAEVIIRRWWRIPVKPTCAQGIIGLGPLRIRLIGAYSFRSHLPLPLFLSCSLTLPLALSLSSSSSSFCLSTLSSALALGCCLYLSSISIQLRLQMSF